MCDFCENEKTIFSGQFFDRFSWGWGGDTKVTIAEAIEKKMGVFIDRGFFRFADLDDCSCMDHGDRVKINFCPFCGDKLGNSEGKPCPESEG